ncbi:MAG: phosphatase PAP2 family protein [Alphaproteobacteria bacterium]|nr:phosphatase PAP2 family protein [Alphaproteobacteria bacterium]
MKLTNRNAVQRHGYYTKCNHSFGTLCKWIPAFFGMTVYSYLMKNLFMLFLLFIFSSSSLQANWDSPNFITSQNDKSIKTQETLGNVGVIALNLFAIGLIAQKEDTQGLREYLYGITTTSAIAFGGKYLIQRPRPDGSDNYSMPSAHSVYSFFASSFISRRYGSQYAAPAYLTAAFVAYSRVAAQKHHITDVLAGGVIGAAVGYMFTTTYTINNHTLSIVPAISKDSVYVRLNVY